MPSTGLGRLKEPRSIREIGIRTSICDDAGLNFLAHLVLAEGPPRVGRPPGAVRPRSGAPVVLDPLALVGSLLPDLARDVPAYRGRRGETHPDLPKRLRDAIVLHRLIDRVTDTHPAFLRTRARLTPRYGRFAGVVADVLFDHVMSRCWDHPAEQDDRFPPMPRAAFIIAAHESLQSDEASAVMPTGMTRTIDAMIEHGWLERYATAPGLDRTFLELSYRFTRRYGRAVDLSGVADHVHQHASELLDDFDELWAALLKRIT